MREHPVGRVDLLGPLLVVIVVEGVGVPKELFTVLKGAPSRNPLHRTSCCAPQSRRGVVPFVIVALVELVVT